MTSWAAINRGRISGRRPDWEKRYADNGFAFDDADLADLFAGLAGGRQRGGQAGGGQRFDVPIPGQDFEVSAQISLDDAYRGTLLDLNLSIPEYDENGHLRRVPREFKARGVIRRVGR